jgi:hypothetical protein
VKNISRFFFDADGGGNTGGAGDPAKTTVAYTQDQLNALFAERASRASTSAVAELLKQAGVEKPEDLIALAKEGRTLKQGQMSELEKANAAIADLTARAQKAESERVATLAQVTERLMKASVMAAAAATVRDDAVNDVWLLIDRSKITEKDGEFVGIKEAVEALTKAKPYLLKDGTSKPSGTPKPGTKKTPGTDSGNQSTRPGFSRF